MRTRKPARRPRSAAPRRRTIRPRVARQFGRGLPRRRPGALSSIGKKIQELQTALESGEITSEEFEAHLEQLEAQQRHSRAAMTLINKARLAGCGRQHEGAIEAADVMLLQNAVKQLAKMESADHAVRMLRDIVDAAGEMMKELGG